MNRVKSVVLLLISLSLLFLVIGGVSAGYLFYYRIHQPLQLPGRHLFLTIKKGDSFREVEQKLIEMGVLKKGWTFFLLGKIMGYSRHIQAGEFLINTRWSMLQLLTYLVKGPPYLHEVLIPEGLTWWQVGEILNREGIVPFTDFKKIVFDKEFLLHNHIPGASVEGYLFPDTYKFQAGKGIKYAREVAETMVDEFWRVARTRLWPQGLPSYKKVFEIVILASMVEKEAMKDFERPIIAGVFINRLKKHMRLQCDPTVIYGLGINFSGRLRKKDLQDKSNPYNTYVYFGLPPGPICSPGVASLEAAIHPMKHSYLYFVARGNGTHKFSKTLKEHNRAVYKYLIKK